MILILHHIYNRKGRKYNDKSPTQYTDQDIKDLESHIPEYTEIEGRAKMNGTWLKMPDGSTWKGDPRSWVQLQSKALQEHHNPEAFVTGYRREGSELGERTIWGLPTNGQQELAFARARTYTKDDDHVLTMVTDKIEDPEKITTVNAHGDNWRFIRTGKPGETTSTDDIVNANRQLRKKKIVRINNVEDIGDHIVPADSKYYYNGIGNDKSIPQDDIVLLRGAFRKALVGGDGMFKHPTNIYRSLIPTIATTGTTAGLGYPMYNYLQQSESYDRTR